MGSRGPQPDIKRDKLVYKLRVGKDMSFREIAYEIGEDVRSVHRRFKRECERLSTK